MKYKHFTLEQIEYYSKDARVKFINEEKLVLTLDFRSKLYDECFPCFNTASVRNALNRNEFRTQGIYSAWFGNLAVAFMSCKPKGATNSTMYIYDGIDGIDKSYNDYLLSTGVFVKQKGGMAFSDKFIQEVYAVYPNVSIVDYLKSKSIDTSRIGYSRIRKLRDLLEKDIETEVRINESERLVLSSNPYVEKATRQKFFLKDNFYNEAVNYRHLHINDILRIFEIDPLIVPISSKNTIKSKLSRWKMKACADLYADLTIRIKIEKNKQVFLEQMVLKGFEVMQNYLLKCSKLEKKSICKIINELPYDKDYCYTKRQILKHIGISKTSFYSLLKDDNYGQYEANKDINDLRDIECIKTVINYKEFKKGSRMVYMMLPRLTGITMSRNKILRLCKKANITCGVRKHNFSRQSSRKLLKENCQPNILKRQFRLYKPSYVILSDVSYIQYGKGRAYLSALKDSCTGKIHMVVSENNDMTLAFETIRHLNNPTDNAKLFHTDQGILYLSPSFQRALTEKGFTISMSKRGNCWDNASQESFFGHLKDECNIRECETFDDLVNLIKDYEYYYNNERPQWSRNKMTPVEFEKYINNMSDEEYERYHAIERKKYDKMMSEAAEKAIKRAKDIGVDNS